MFKKMLFLFLTAAIALSACSTLEVRFDQTPTAIAIETLSVIPSITPVATPVATFTPAIPTPTVSNIQTYVDPDFGFKLQYDISWQLDVKSGSGMVYYDGNGRTVWLRKAGYIFQLAVVGGPVDVKSCAGMFSTDQQNSTDHFWVYTVDGVELWRSKAERGEINGYDNNDVSFIEIISPLELYKEPKIDENSTNWGSFTCRPQISNHGVNINYMLPVSLANIKAGNFSQEILTEMDNILISLTWK